MKSPGYRVSQKITLKWIVQSGSQLLIYSTYFADTYLRIRDEADTDSTVYLDIWISGGTKTWIPDFDLSGHFAGKRLKMIKEKCFSK